MSPKHLITTVLAETNSSISVCYRMFADFTINTRHFSTFFIKSLYYLHLACSSTRKSDCGFFVNDSRQRNHHLPLRSLLSLIHSYKLPTKMNVW